MDWRIRDVAVMFGLIAVYVALMTSLALTEDRRFFFNDGVSLVTWVIIGVVLVAGGVRVAKRW